MRYEKSIKITTSRYDDGDDGTTTMCRRPDDDSSAARRRCADGTRALDRRHDDCLTTTWRRCDDSATTARRPSQARVWHVISPGLALNPGLWHVISWGWTPNPGLWRSSLRRRTVAPSWLRRYVVVMPFNTYQFYQIWKSHGFWSWFYTFQSFQGIILHILLVGNFKPM